MDGLVYVSDEMPGIRRRRRGRGFSYEVDHGQVSERDKERIRALVIPPAWSDVWICPDANGHLQATGRDAKGRKQYRYHDLWRTERDHDKYERLLPFGRALAELREAVDDRLDGPGPLTKERVVALVIALLDETLIRVGNVEYTANGSFGLTTFTTRHLARDEEGLQFRFKGKSGIEHEVALDDPRLARLVRRCHRLGGQSLFTYRNGDGDPIPVSSTDVNEALHEITRLEVTAKDFRTWGGTVIVTEALSIAQLDGADDGQIDEAVRSAIDEAAERLGNTRAVCRSSYVHPDVLAAAEDGTLAAAWSGARAHKHLRRGEVALLAVLEET